MSERIFNSSSKEKHAVQFSADINKSLPLNSIVKTGNEEHVPKLKKQYFKKVNLYLEQQWIVMTMAGG